MIEVVLDWPELTHGATIGIMRQISAIAHRRREVRGVRSGREWQWDAHIEGACAELAVARHLGLYWHALVRSVDPAAPCPDVGSNIQVKRRPADPSGRKIDLRLNDADLDECPYVLVVGNAPRYQIRGWILGRNGKRKEWSDPGDGRPCYFVPCDQLRPMPDLVEMLAGVRT